jgi:transposase
MLTFAGNWSANWRCRPRPVGESNELIAAKRPLTTRCVTHVSIVSTARANGLEPYAYLRRLFAHLPKAKTVEDFEALLPFNAALAVP